MGENTNPNDVWDAQERIYHIERALAKLHSPGGRPGTQLWAETVDWAIKGLLEKQLKEDRRAIWLGTHGVDQIDIEASPPAPALDELRKPVDEVRE